MSPAGSNAVVLRRHGSRGDTGHMTDVSEAGVNRVTHSKTKICLQPDPEVLMSLGVLLL